MPETADAKDYARKKSNKIGDVAWLKGEGKV